MNITTFNPQIFTNDAASEIFDRADREMYEDKQHLKKEEGIHFQDRS